MAFAVTEGWDGSRQVIGLVATGLFQGLVLGIGEVVALRRGPLRVPAWRWIIVTTLAMGVAWIAALLPGSFGEPDWSNPVVLVGIIVAILVVILIVPIAQWLLLRSRGRDAWRWIVIMSISTTLGVGSLLTGILLAEGKTSFIGTLLPFILTGWVGILLFTIVSGLGVYWMAREAYTSAETSAVLARRAANESRVTTASKKAAARVGAQASPAIKKMASKVSAVAKKAGSQTLAAAKKTATRVKSRTAAASVQAKARAKERAKERAKAQAKKTSGK
jgi:multisubunit Na+/H+ antiporter MnhG subunit